MGSVRRRLERLEEQGGRRREASEERRVAVKVLCNEFAAANGEDSELLTAQEQEIEEVMGRRFIEEDIPELRRDPGWQTPEARETLDAWERDTLRELGGEAGM